MEINVLIFVALFRSRYFSSSLAFVACNATQRRKRECGTPLCVYSLSAAKERVGVPYVARLWTRSCYCTAFDASCHYATDFAISRDDKMIKKFQTHLGTIDNWMERLWFEFWTFSKGSCTVESSLCEHSLGERSVIWIVHFQFLQYSGQRFKCLFIYG